MPHRVMSARGSSNFSDAFTALKYNHANRSVKTLSELAFCLGKLSHPHLGATMRRGIKGASNFSKRICSMTRRTFAAEIRKSTEQLALYGEECMLAYPQFTSPSRSAQKYADRSKWHMRRSHSHKCQYSRIHDNAGEMGIAPPAVPSTFCRRSSAVERSSNFASKPKSCTHGEQKGKKLLKSNKVHL